MQECNYQAEVCDFEFWYVFGHVLKINDGIKSVKSCIIEQIGQCNSLSDKVMLSVRIFPLVISEYDSAPLQHGKFLRCLTIRKVFYESSELEGSKLKEVNWDNGNGYFWDIYALKYWYISNVALFSHCVDWLWWVWLLCANTNFLDRMTQLKWTLSECLYINADAEC